MNISRLLLSLPLRRQTVVGALVMATVLFIVYQFTFVAELGQANRGRHGPNLDANGRKHPRDVNFRDAARMMAKNVVDSGRDEKHNDNRDDRNNVIAKNMLDSGKEKQGDRDKGNIIAKNIVDSGKEEKQGHRDDGSNARQSPNQIIKPNAKQATSKHSMTLTFKCETSGRQISIDKLNDNYCDCPEDGSDEPRTNACANGRFICLKYVKPFPESIPSGWVNDGVCDCCDGSDEWKMRKSVADLAVNLQKKIGRYLSPCPNQCPNAV